MPDLTGITKNDVVLSVFYHGPGIISRCGMCRRLFCATHYALVAEVKVKRYLLGEDRVRTCGCKDKERRAPLHFFGKDDAEDGLTQVKEWFVSEKGTLEELFLLDSHRHLFIAEKT